MNIKIISIHIIILVFVLQSAICQSGREIRNSSVNFNDVYLSGELFNPGIMPEINTYFNFDWAPGDILLEDSSLIRNVKIKYNGLLDELFWLEPVSRKAVKLDKEAILRFHFYNTRGDTSVYFRKFRVKREGLPDSIEIFGEELLIKDYSLYLQHSFFFAGTKQVQLNKRVVLKDNFKKEDVYYMVYNDKVILRFKRFSRKNIYSLFPEKKQIIRKFLNENSTGRMTEKDQIVSVLKFINSISVKQNI